MLGQRRTPRLAASLALCCLIQPQSCTLPPAPKPVIQPTDTNPGAKPGSPVCPHIPKAPAAKPPPPPPSGLPQILQPGHWEWDDGGYVWTPPAWHARSGNRTQWRNGYWEPNGGACVWHNGQFVPAAPPSAPTKSK